MKVLECVILFVGFLVSWHLHATAKLPLYWISFITMGFGYMAGYLGGLTEEK